MQLCPAGIGHRDQGGLSTLGGEIHKEYTRAREDVWSYLHVFSFTDLKRRLNLAFCSGRTTITDLHSSKIVILPLERYIKKKWLCIYGHAYMHMYVYIFMYIYFFLFLDVFKKCLPRKDQKTQGFITVSMS